MSLNVPLPDLSTIEEQPETIETLRQMESNTSASGHAPQEGKTPQEENAFNYDQYWLEPNGLGEAQLTYLPPQLQNLELIQDLVDPLNHIIDDFPTGREEEKPSYYQFLTCWIRQSLHQVVEQTTNTVLQPFILDPHDRYMKALASQKTEPHFNIL